MKLKKINAALGLVSIVTMLVHIGYTDYAYLAFYYNPTLKQLTSLPFMIVTCLHAFCGMVQNGRTEKTKLSENNLGNLPCIKGHK